MFFERIKAALPEREIVVADLKISHYIGHYKLPLWWEKNADSSREARAMAKRSSPRSKGEPGSE